MGPSMVEAREVRTKGDWLSAYDLVVTVFSLCGLDRSFLSDYSPTPLGCILYLATNEPVRRFIAELSGINKFSTINQGIGGKVENLEKISTVIRYLLAHNSVQDYYEKSKRAFWQKPISAIEDCLTATLDTH
jgi:hypothetical protein